MRSAKTGGDTPKDATRSAMPARDRASAAAGDETSQRLLPAFGSVVIDTRTGDVYRGGQFVVLKPEELETLMALLRRRGAVATRSDLINEVAERTGIAQSQWTVSAHIANLRRKLEDRAHRPRHLRTAWGHGYFIQFR